MTLRKPSVAGAFYPASEKDCKAAVADCLTDRPVTVDLPEKVFAGIVPHAGWTFSGELAGMVFSAIEDVDKKIDTFIIFGAAHRYYSKQAAVYDKGQWLTPLGKIDIDQELAEAIIDTSDFAAADTEAHKFEHSIEVQVPLIQYLFPAAKIVPIITAPVNETIHLGSDTAEAAKKFPDKNIVFIGSTDLTHYGPRYGFNPQGNGTEAIRWAKEVNDKTFIDPALAMNPEQIIENAVQHDSACGPGAAAAAVSAAKASGAKKGMLLAHTHSNEIMEKRFAQTSDESVGYAAMVF